MPGCRVLCNSAAAEWCRHDPQLGKTHALAWPQGCHLQACTCSQPPATDLALLSQPAATPPCWTPCRALRPSTTSLRSATTLEVGGGGALWPLRLRAVPAFQARQASHCIVCMSMGQTEKQAINNASKKLCLCLNRGTLQHPPLQPVLHPGGHSLACTLTLPFCCTPPLPLQAWAAATTPPTARCQTTGSGEQASARAILAIPASIPLPSLHGWHNKWPTLGWLRPLLLASMQHRGCGKDTQSIALLGRWASTSSKPSCNPARRPILPHSVPVLLPPSLPPQVSV